jgi:hypothetical protein
MKKSHLTLALYLLVALPLLSFSPTSKVNPGGNSPDNADSIPPGYFISDTFFGRYNLVLKDAYNPNMRVWARASANGKYYTVNDIRLNFPNQRKAIKYFRKNLVINSEHAVEIHPVIIIPGVEELHVFKESDAMVKSIMAKGVNMHYFFYLFVIDHVYAKVFVAANPETTPEEASLFAKQAAVTILKATGK